MGRAYSCWMLNCWCITWPVGFKRLMIDSHIEFPAFCYSAVSIATDRASKCIADTNIIFVARSTSSNGNSFAVQSSLLTQYFWTANQKLLVLLPTSKFRTVSTLILFKMIYVHTQQETRLNGKEWYVTLIKDESFKFAGKKYHLYARAKNPSNKTRWKINFITNAVR